MNTTTRCNFLGAGVVAIAASILYPNYQIDSVVEKTEPPRAVGSAPSDDPNPAKALIAINANPILEEVAVAQADPKNDIKPSRALTASEQQMSNKMIYFLDTCTGNGKINYGSKKSIVKALLGDPIGLEAGAKGFLEHGIVRAYLNTGVGEDLVRDGIESGLKEDLDPRLKLFGVSESTVNTPDTKEPRKLYTKATLDEYKRHCDSFFLLLKELYPGKIFKFEEGMSSDDVACIRDGKFPPGATVRKSEDVLAKN